MTMWFQSASSPETGEDNGSVVFPAVILHRGEREAVLRYGENPHQQAAFYRDVVRSGPNLADTE